VITGIAILLLVLFLCVNYLFLKPALQRLCAKIYDRTDIAVDFSEVDGELWLGKFTIKNMTLKRDLDQHLDLDLKIKSTAIDFSIKDIFFGKIVCDSLHIDGVSGKIIKKEKKKKKPRKNFLINEFRLTNTDIEFSSHKHPNRGIDIAIEKLVCYDVQSKQFVYHTMFQSNAQGTIAKRKFVITTTMVNNGYDNTWHMIGLPLGRLHGVFSGPFAWLRDGLMDMRMENNCRNGEVKMHYKFSLSNFVAQIPEESKLNGVIARAVEGYLNKNRRKLGLNLQFIMEERDLANMRSLDNSQLTTKIANAWFQSLIDRIGIRGPKKLWNNLKNIWSNKKEKK